MKRSIVGLLFTLCSVAAMAAGPDSTAISLTPAKIARRSAFLPGYGQHTNHQTWKSPIAAGGVAIGLAAIYQTQQWKSDYQTAARIRLDDDPNTTDQYVASLPTDALLVAANQRQQWHTNAIFYTLYAYSMNVLDAYTYALLAKKPTTHPPAKAAYYSALLPGMGQLYNKKWWKLPIVYGALGTSIGFIAFNQQRYRDTQIAYITRTDNYPNNTYETDFTVQFTNENLLDLQDFYRRNRDLSYIITAGLYLLNIVDAIVDGHLYSFDVSDDLSWQPKVRPLYDFSPTAHAYGGLSVSFTF